MDRLSISKPTSICRRFTSNSTCSCITTTGTVMPEILQYSFMVRALLAGLIVAVLVPVLGSFLVSRRYSLVSDSLAHVSLAGVGAGLLLGFAPVAAAIPVTVGGALLLEWL